MNVMAMFVLGLLIGWLAEWAMDWYYWRGRISTVVNENTNLQERIASLESKRKPRRTSTKGLPLTDKDGNDNFQAIKGIGSAFSKRLKEGGVTTFEQLSKLSVRDLEEILGPLFKRFFSKASSIRAEAEEFARQKAEQS